MECGEIVNEEFAMMDDTQAATSRRGSATGAEVFMKAAALRSWPTIYFPCEGRQRVNSSEPSTSD